VSITVVHLTAELWPWARTGGLGQVAAELPMHQARAGARTAVIVPMYRVAREQLDGLEPVCDPFTIKAGALATEVRCFELPREGADCPRTMFLDHPPSFDRPGIYGEAGADYPDNAQRFAIFALGALEVALRVGGERPIIHAHDWHAALAPVYLRVTHARRQEFAHIPSVLSVHNGGFHGLFGRDTLPVVGLPDWLWSLDYMEWYGRLNYLKGGLKYADMVTTVSPTHAREMTTAVGGFGLDHTFRDLKDRLVGIRNGIDDVLWDPATDPDLTANYSADDMTGKAKCKAALQRAWNVPVRTRTPVFAMSARLVTQKGLDLIVGSRTLREVDAQFLFLGSGEARLEAALAELCRAYPERVGLNVNFTDRLEHRLLAGADFLLMPSLYEPCGLTQMRAQRYGALPIGRTVGGLADTIEDEVSGFLFDGYTPEAFDEAVARALRLYENKPEYLRRAQGAMRRDFSWKQPVSEYMQVYQRALARR
jgi:starch synthase